MASIHQNKQKHLIIQMSKQEAKEQGFETKGSGQGLLICTVCGQVIESDVYYAATIHDILCKDCIKEYHEKADPKTKTQYCQAERDLSLEYDERTPVSLFSDYYIVTKNQMYGVINKWNDIILPTLFRSIKSYEEAFRASTNNIVVIQDAYGYFLFSLQKSEILTDHYESIDFLQGKRNTCTNIRNCSFYIGVKNGKRAVISSLGKQLTDFAFDEVLLYRSRFLKLRNGSKWGLINRLGEELLPVSYDSIRDICGDLVNIEDNGTIKQIKIDRSKLLFSDIPRINTWESSTYDKYSGSYAQDEMGYSDDDIDTIFEGDPNAYWNID